MDRKKLKHDLKGKRCETCLFLDPSISKCWVAYKSTGYFSDSKSLKELPKEKVCPAWKSLYIDVVG